MPHLSRTTQVGRKREREKRDGDEKMVRHRSLGEGECLHTSEARMHDAVGGNSYSCLCRLGSRAVLARRKRPMATAPAAVALACAS